MKRALIIIAERDFQDMEYSNTRKALESSGISVAVASKTRGMKRGVLGNEVEAELSFKDIKIKDFDAVAFIGGEGAQEYIEDDGALGIVKSFFEGGKITAAICIAPLILASSGILNGKKITAWDNGRRIQIRKLERSGAIFVGGNVVVDRNIITADGPGAASEFGKEIAKGLNKK
ncbi:MAG: DJ-1/PfpI family protein [Nanoarchaeota archaeon]|nr:DJ-1/PfpI family protein [Nanoarchaeota archaeon]